MKSYIRTNDEGAKVLDMNLLDVGATANFYEDLGRWADDLDIDDIDKGSAEERVAWIRSMAEMSVKGLEDYGMYDDEGNEMPIVPETAQFMIDFLIDKMATRYEVEELPAAELHTLVSKAQDKPQGPTTEKETRHTGSAA